MPETLYRKSSEYSVGDIEGLLKDYDLFDYCNNLGDKRHGLLQSLKILVPLVGNTKEDFEQLIAAYIKNEKIPAEYLPYEDRKPKAKAAGA